jgi:energy-coupling factor transporter ATP-binding protein EcfA2
MWIERIDFAGFGNLSGERLEFEPNKLNLIVEPNDFGKSTIADAIWATLFDFPPRNHSEQALIALRQAKRPNRAQTPFIVSLDIVLEERPLKIIRDFEDGSVQVFDRNRGNEDVTDQFMASNSESGEDIGLRLCGITRETFLSTFYTGQRRLQTNLIAGNLEILALLQTICESSAGARSANDALSVLSQALSQFPFKGNNEKLDALIRTLESHQVELKSRISSFDMQRANLHSDLSEASAAQKQIRSTGVNAKAQEHVDLCLLIAELDEQLIKVKGRSPRKRELQLELVNLSSAEEFPADTAIQVREFWSRRQIRLAEYQKIASDISPGRSQLQEEQAMLKERLPGCDKFSIEDFQNLDVLATTLQQTQTEVLDLGQRRKLEASRVMDQSSIDIDRVEQMRKSLYPLDTREVDSARTYDALINAAQTQIAECGRLINEARSLVDEIEAEKKNKKAVFFNASTHRKRESELAEIQIQQQTTLMDEMVAKVTNLRSRLRKLAQKAGLPDGAELLKHVQEYSTKSIAVRDIGALDQVLAGRETIFAKNKQDLQPYFNKAGQGELAITAESARALTNDVLRYSEGMRNIETRFASVKQALQNLEVIGNEVNDAEGLLESIFMRAHLSDPANLEASYAEFQEKLKAHERFKAITNELSTTGSDIHTPNLEEEARLDSQRSQAFAKMQDLVKRYPELADLPPPAQGGNVTTSDQESVGALESKLEQLRSGMVSFDQTYLDSVRELDGVEYDLTHLRQSRAAIELARDTLQRLANDSSYDWLDQLNGTMRKWATRLGLDYDAVEFGTDLRVTVRRKGQRGSSSHIMHQLSSSARQQVHLLSRLAVCDVLSQNIRLPIVVDEPLSEIDDDAFLKIMKFLFDEVVPDHQVIMFSSHRARYEWLMQNLTDDQKKLITICRKTSLRTDAVTS